MTYRYYFISFRYNNQCMGRIEQMPQPTDRCLLGELLMSLEFASRDLSAKYDRFARWCDCVEGILDFIGVRKLWQTVFSKASGKVLEVAIGTGKNLYYYRRDCQIIAVDLSTEMLKQAR